MVVGTGLNPEIHTCEDLATTTFGYLGKEDLLNRQAIIEEEEMGCREERTKVLNIN